MASDLYEKGVLGRRGRGYITSTPNQFFRKNGIFGEKMNGIPVSPGPKTQNAPTWQGEKNPGKLKTRPGSGHFLLLFGATGIIPLTRAKLSLMTKLCRELD